MSNSAFEKVYNPAVVEDKWGKFWLAEELFKARVDSEKSAFSIVIPPPNVTGSLHMGHALNVTLQDILVRYKNMKGFNTLWLPGTDHAGIATQNVVEKLLADEGLDRQSMGREKFLERVWLWKEQSGDTITNQLKRLGASCDWSRERFTMDPGLSRAVRHAFVLLFKKGLIYRANYMTNWCPRCHTALSDLEVDFKTVHGKLYYIRYPGEQGADVLVATTRPETMLGDTAVAINPSDKRFAGWEGKRVSLPLTGRTIPIISDKMVDPEFGTGAVKITPAHDFNDFEVARIHNLPFVRVISENGSMSEDAGERYRGLDRIECRKAVVKDLEAIGLLDRVEDYTHNVGCCYRCETVVEPTVSLQWFVRVAPLAEKAIDAVKRNRTSIIPEMWEKTYFEWMYNIKDWCISRQIWWGHRIPAWHCNECGAVTVELDDPERCGQCESMHLTQEEDVLDTWFSSALWPFSTLGWPDSTRELEVYYPTSVLVTAFDILFFWVARMMMMGLEFMDDVPFRHVFIHALVRDVEGYKMSKTRGNVIDPLEVMEKYGTDAFRFTLTALAAQGRDIKMSEERIEGYRNFINKLWNTARFIHLNLGGFKEGDPEPDCVEDLWILSRLGKTVRGVTEAFDEYRFNEAAGLIYQFLWHEYCDWYVEISKPYLIGDMGDREKERKQIILVFVFGTVLRLAHPIIPFVTEEIWHSLPGERGSLLLERFPEFDENVVDEESEVEMNYLISLIRAVRHLRRELNIPPGYFAKVRLRGGMLERVKKMETVVKRLARLESIDYLPDGAVVRNEASSVAEDTDIFLPIKGVLDFKAERERIEKAIAKLMRERKGLVDKLSNSEFVMKAPEGLVNTTRAREEEIGRKLERLNVNLQLFTE